MMATPIVITKGGEQIGEPFNNICAAISYALKIDAMRLLGPDEDGYKDGEDVYCFNDDYSMRNM